eukprot:3357763-Rhodomonas_salina.6
MERVREGEKERSRDGSGCRWGRLVQLRPELGALEPRGPLRRPLPPAPPPQRSLACPLASHPTPKQPSFHASSSSSSSFAPPPSASSSAAPRQWCWWEKESGRRDSVEDGEGCVKGAWGGGMRLD